MTALALLLACTPALEWSVDLDAQLIGKSAIDAGRARSHTLVGVRGGVLQPLGHGLHAGLDLGLHLEPLPHVRGTDVVNSVTLQGALWPRGLVGWRAEWGPLALFPYAFAGPAVGAQVVALNAFDETHNNSRLTWALRGGGGLRFRVGHAQLGLELGGGVGERGPEVYGLFTSGFWL